MIVFCCVLPASNKARDDDDDDDDASRVMCPKSRVVRVELFTARVLLSSILSSTRIPTDTGCDELNVNGK